MNLKPRPAVVLPICITLKVILSPDTKLFVVNVPAVRVEAPDANAGLEE